MTTGRGCYGRSCQKRIGVPAPFSLPEKSEVPCLVDPNTAATLTTSQIVAMVDDLLEAYGDLIPEDIRRG
jgi:hypothetical protein